MSKRGRLRAWVLWAAVAVGPVAVGSEATLVWTFGDGRRVTETVGLVPAEDGAGERLVLPRDRIRAKGAVRLDIVPEFARARKGERGFWFTPYGLYGEYDCDDGTHFAGKDRMPMPMFGWSNARGAYLAVVESLKYFVRENVVAKNGAYEIAAVLERELCEQPYEDLVIRYHRRPADASYAALAKIYRAEQLKRGVVRPFTARFKENKVLEQAILAPEIRIRQAWKPVPSPVKFQSPENEPPVHVAVTFARVKAIADELKRQGVADAELCLVGWNVGGHDGRWPQYFPAEPKLGGDEALKDAIRHVRGLGYLIVPHGNFVEGYTVADSWDAEWVTKNEDGSLRLYDQRGTTWGGGLPYKMCPQRSYERFCSKQIPRLAAYGFKGLGYFDVTTICEPVACHDPRHPCGRHQGVAYWGLNAALSQHAFGGFQSEGCNDYLGGGLDFSLYDFFGDPAQVETRHLEKKGALAKRVVPILQIVYNGIIAQNPFTTTMNVTLKDRCAQLKAIEFSGRPAFYFYQKFKTGGKSWMGSEDLTCATDEELRASVGRIREGYDRYQKLKHLQLAFIEEHGEIAPKVFRTVYSNGESVVCDYNTLEWRLTGGNGTDPR